MILRDLVPKRSLMSSCYVIMTIAMHGPWVIGPLFGRTKQPRAGDKMHWARALILLCTLMEAGWMAFDGSRALVVGDFISPTSGPHAGQLGPWRHLVQRVGLDPHGTPIKVIFAVYGWAWILVGVEFARGASWSWSAMLGAALGALWFLPLGTLFSVVQVALLLLFRQRLA